MDRPSLPSLVAVANGVVTATGEEPVATQRVSFVETGLQFKTGTIWIGIRNLEGNSMALAVDASYDHQGNGFASTTNGEPLIPHFATSELFSSTTFLDQRRSPVVRSRQFNVPPNPRVTTRSSRTRGMAFGPEP